MVDKAIKRKMAKRRWYLHTKLHDYNNDTIVMYVLDVTCVYRSSQQSTKNTGFCNWILYLCSWLCPICSRVRHFCN